jgi:hypothetical protein
LVFDRARLREHAEMFVAGKGPGGREQKSADVLINGEFSVYFGKAEIVTDAETKA